VPLPRYISHTASAVNLNLELAGQAQSASLRAFHAPQAQFMPRSGNSCRRSLQFMREAQFMPRSGNSCAKRKSLKQRLGVRMREPRGIAI